MKKFKSIRHLIALVVVLALMLSTSAVVYAETGSVAVTGGSLAVGPADITLSGVTLDGTDQTSTSTSNAWTAEDPRGTGAGWNLTIASTDFTSDDVQEVYLTGATGGTFTLTYDSVATAAIAFDAAASAVETAIEGLSNVTAATVTGSGASSSPWVIRFVTDTGSGIMTADVALLTGTTPSATITLATIDISVADQQFGITLVDASIVEVAGNTKPVQTSGSLQDIGDATLKFLTAPVDTGMGSYTLDPDFTLEVRAEVYEATYTATITVTINSGP